MKKIWNARHSVWRYPVGTVIFLVGGFIARLVVLFKKDASYKIFYFLSSALVPVIGARVRYEGERPKLEGPTIVVMNHCSFLDIFLTAIIAEGKEGVAFAADKLFKAKYVFLGGLLRAMQTIPVHPDDKEERRQSYDRAIKVLRKNGVIFIFPEGGRSDDGTLKEFRYGAFRMAFETGASIQVIGIKGTFELFSTQPGVVIPGEVVIKFGPQIESKGKTVLGLLVETQEEMKKLFTTKNCKDEKPI